MTRSFICFCLQILSSKGCLYKGLFSNKAAFSLFVLLRFVYLYLFSNKAGFALFVFLHFVSLYLFSNKAALALFVLLHFVSVHSVCLSLCSLRVTKFYK